MAKVTFKKKKNVNRVEAYLENNQVLQLSNPLEALEYLRDFVRLIRPGRNIKNAEAKLAQAIELLQTEKNVLTNVKIAIYAQLMHSNLIPLLTESGLTISRGVGRELHSRFKHKFLPAYQSSDDFLYLLNRIFYKSTDYVWVEAAGKVNWVQFFKTLSIKLSGTEPEVVKQLAISTQMLSSRLSQLGWEKEIVSFVIGEDWKVNNPLSKQQYLVQQLYQHIKEGGSAEYRHELCLQIIEQLQKGQELVNAIRQQTVDKGTSLSQTFILFQIEQLIQRMKLIVDMLDADDRLNVALFVELFSTVIRNENRKNSLMEFLSQTTGYLAYQIAEHKGKKGSKYITSTPAEYWNMIRSAMWGGLIVCFVVVIKLLQGKWHLAPFWQGFAYSINYSAGFIAIEETKSTLATKQPAFTASAVASSLDTRKGTDVPNLYNLAVTVAKIARSQTASFIGNLMIVFPVCFLFAWMIDIITGKPLVSGVGAMHLLQDQHPFQSLSLLYAFNTGCFLFISGILAGYVQNKINYGQVYTRLLEHPTLKYYLSAGQLQKFASYITNHAGSLVGNISLGFFLGMASSVGKIFGMPFDIRHITIAAGNTSFGLYGVGLNNLSPVFILTLIVGVLCIGFINFLVSFTLAFVVAVRSRGVHLRDYPEFLHILWKYFKSSPLDFLRPRKRKQEEIT
ncbi:hypothetical protein [Gynurincola endophyticus]|jgi:site-specific recombinase|uniref:hypothetical protein n=1 Tax=Gynurincola endophyticus TaxID=2479004 RepID=UPI000F8C83B1|nr:hypothetical protein [Gynurincola endophyticus]